MKITIFKRYDINGSWTHDIKSEIGEHENDSHSMWKVDRIIDVSALENKIKELSKTQLNEDK